MLQNDSPHRQKQQNPLCVACIKPGKKDPLTRLRWAVRLMSTNQGKNSCQSLETLAAFLMY